MTVATSQPILPEADAPAHPERDWKWFGHHGHFICGRWCRFHLCTQVGEYLVSTVGQYVHPQHSAGSEQAESAWLDLHPNGEEIGCGSFYETMVFKAGSPCVLEECGCGLPNIDGHELDSRGYLTAGEATRGHRELCIEYAAKGSPPVTATPMARRGRPGMTAPSQAKPLADLAAVGEGIDRLRAERDDLLGVLKTIADELMSVALDLSNSDDTRSWAYNRAHHARAAIAKAEGRP